MTELKDSIVGEKARGVTRFSKEELLEYLEQQIKLTEYMPLKINDFAEGMYSGSLNKLNLIKAWVLSTSDTKEG